MNLFEFLEVKSLKAGKDDVVIFQFKRAYLYASIKGY